MTDTLTQLTYQAFQQGKSYFGVAHKTLSHQIGQLVAPQPQDKTIPLSPEVLAHLQRSIERLQEIDWQDAERGVYPTEILFDNPWADFFQYYPLVWFDLPQIWERLGRKEYQQFDAHIDTTDYPKYYVQNFHHQTNGYLSDLSANLYDLQVELLFNGSADAMRRRVLAPIKAALHHFSDVRPSQQRVLDVATGTGRTLRFLRNTLPQASLHGTDLSPDYLRKANQQLSELPEALPQLCQANAEHLPYRDDYFHAITCVFLFHELPPQARQNVIDQCYRVLKPGGTFVICDSIQKDDEPKFAPLLHNFPITFHEPYYRSYTEDDMTARLETAGFTDIGTQVHFMSKYWIARKEG
ncbi:class I SAM-dependent methyltransferase [Baaleninema sp.]|uniref:class I SAM-dependent methyltransferase n=1 Tax=Baaleninema sp. TaxID=3101197 RepID=UPI003CFC4FD4